MAEGRPAAAGWAYVSLVGAIPGTGRTARRTILIQFVAFEGIAVALALLYGRLGALPLGTVAIGIASVGSAMMLRLSEDISTLDLPASYRRLLFGSSADVVLGLVSFVGLLTYLLTRTPGDSDGLLVSLLGDPLPAPAVFFALLVAWDLCYRIGTGWLASVAGLWRSVAFAGRLGPPQRATSVRADGLTIAFAGLQLLLVPFLRSEPLLAFLLLGHVAAVAIVSMASILVLRRS